MRNRPASWPLVSVGLMGAGIGAVGILFYFLSGAAEPKPMPVAFESLDDCWSRNCNGRMDL